MGNISSMARASTALDSYVAELGNDISYDKSLSSSRFLKTILARHAYGPIVLKIFIKPDASMSLRLIQNRLKKERDSLKDLPGTATYQAFIETDKAGYLIRQWTGSNLYDRVSTQPYLAGIEKKWIAFQLLTSLRDARTLSIAHGDIKSENVLITSDLSVLLTDFSSAFKPTYLPLDDPSDFSFFFDTSNRRTCYIAPERFYGADSSMAASKRSSSSKGGEGSDVWQKRDPPPTEVMDVFSAGCVLAEMWTDGRTVFNLSESYAYRDGSLSLDGILDNIEDRHVKDMIRQMLSRNPDERPTFDRILADFRETIFPEYFYTFLKDYAASLGELPAGQGQGFVQRSAGQSGTKIDRMLDEWDSISVHLNKVDENGPALLLLNIVTSSIRNCLWPSSRLHGLQLFLKLRPFLLDEDKIDRIIPFIVELLSDDVAIVRAEACRVLVTIVESITSITPFNAPFIPEYLLPQMRYLSTDPDVFVRATYARALVRLADAAVNMLEMSQAKITSEEAGIDNYDSMLLEIQTIVEEQATTLLVDPSSNVKRAMLADISDLCLFFGRQKANETVLSHMMTYLNDRDWHLRLAFFDGIVGVGAFIGIKAIEEYVLPLMLQALADSEEAVVARVISSLTSLAALGLLSRMRLWDVFFAIRGFLCHPDAWIRQSTVGFVAAAARNLPASDTWCILYPSLRTMLSGDVLELDEDSIMAALIPPLSRATLVAAKNLILGNSPPGFWDLPYSNLSSKAQLTKSALATPANPAPQLKDKGISSRDEKKIVAMKEFIVKQAHASRAREAAESVESNLVNGKSIPLGELGVPPQTVFISPRTVGVDATANLRRLRPHLGAGSSSRRTSFASRATNQVEDVRKRLASVEIKPQPPAPPSHRSGPSTSTIPTLPDAPSESGISASLEFAAMTRPAKKRVEPKVAPAIAAVNATAMGTTSLHDETASGRSTPTASTPRAGAAAAAYGSTYEGQDPGVRAFLDQMDLENYREPQLDFGPRVTSTTRKRRIKPPPGGGQGGNVTLIAQMSDHKGAITGLVASPDNLWFASTSEDRAIMIWDSARLERSVITKPRLAYMMNAPISCICRIENTHCLAVGAEDGQLVVLRVHVAGTKYLKVEAIRSWHVPEGEGYVKFVSHQGMFHADVAEEDSALLIVTSTSVMASLDIRTMEISKRYENPLEHGVITAISVQKNWLVVGTETGVLSLWDLRFGLLLKSWMASGAINSLELHPARGKVNDEPLWLVVAIQRATEEAPVVEVYIVESGKLVETYEIRSTKPAKSTAAPTDAPMPDKAGLIAKIAAARDPFGANEDPPPSVLSLLVGHKFPSMTTPEEPSGGLMSTLTDRPSPPSASGYMVTGGEDRVVRYWDLVKPSEGFVICGSAKEKEVTFRHSQGSTPALYYTLPSRPDKVSSAKAPPIPQPLRPHYDAICTLGHVETPFSSCVISGDRSGVLKVWRMEGGGSKG